MSRVAVLSPTTLLGKEVRDLLDGDPKRFGEVVLLATRDDEAGAVTESRGGAALVQKAGAGALAGVDLVFACGALEDDLALVGKRPEGATAILLSPEATVGHGRAVVAGWESDAVAGEVLVSPHPAAIALTHLLAPLGDLEVAGAAATVVLPSSFHGSEGLDGLLDQTRDILAMTGSARPSVFERQLAFNLYPAAEAPGELARLVHQAARVESPLAVHLLQGAVFHGVAVSLFVAFESDPGLEALRDALGRGRHVSLAEPGDEGGDTPGPIDAAAREDVLVGGVRADPGYGAGYWLWAVMDNLTRGGASNAVEIAQSL